MIRTLLILLSLLAMMAGCSDHDDALPGDGYPTETAPLPHGRRTVLVYMAMQNSLEDYGCVRNDSLELVRARAAVRPDDRLLVLIDDSRPPRLYRIGADTEKPVRVHRWASEANSTSPVFLSSVLRLVRERYSADSYGLVIESHGDGWLPAIHPSADAQPRLRFIGEDSMGDGDGNTTQMDLSALADAITAAGIHMDYIFFDACLMQTVEGAWALRHVTDHVIASPIAVPYSGADYELQVNDGLFADQPDRAIIDQYMRVADSDGMALAAVCPARLDSLAAVLRRALPSSPLAGRTSPDMSGVTTYQGYGWKLNYRPYHFDAIEALQHLLPDSTAAEARRAIDYAVTYHAATDRVWIGPSVYNFARVNPNTTCSMAIFVPQSVYTYNAARCIYGDLNACFARTAWYDAAGWQATGW